MNRLFKPPPDLRETGKEASFRRMLIGLERSVALLPQLDPGRTHPHLQLPFKLRNYRLAASHGVDVPTVYASWLSPRDIDLTALPDQFVLKSDGGHSDRGVLPLRRVEEDLYELLDGTRRLTGQQAVDEFNKPGVRRPYFAEEVIVQPDGGPIPDDVKVYAAYGEIMHVMLRRKTEHADTRTAAFRYLDSEGRDLGSIQPRRTTDPRIPPPVHLEEVVVAARHLSRAVGIPFCRVDVYDTSRGVVFGEITPIPGGRQLLTDEHDKRLGAQWEAARWRLDLDLLAGRPPGILHGEAPAPNLYPAGHGSYSDAPTWSVRQVACGQWC